MNVIAFNAAYSLYPHITFEERTSLLMTNDNTRAASAVAKYCARGWTFTRAPLPNKTQHYHIGMMRSVSDSMTWRIPLSLEGVQIRAALSPTSPLFTWDPIQPNTWAIVRRDRLIMHYNIQRTYCLRYCYITAMTALYESVKEHLDGQNLIERSKVETIDEVQRSSIYTWSDISIIMLDVCLIIFLSGGMENSLEFY
jgi:hypothetical protein